MALSFEPLALWPLNRRVGENSPSLCPTMFSVTYTGMNFLPLWTAIVWPTISGVIVDRRDHVLWTLRSFAAFMFVIAFSSGASMKGPFLTERAILFRLPLHDELIRAFVV